MIIIPIFAIVIILVVATTVTVLSFSNETLYTYAYSQEKLTDKETLKVKLTTEPEDPKAGEDTKINIEFIDSQSNRIQKNVDYKVTIENDGNHIPVSNRQTHTVSGLVSIHVTLEDGTNIITINIGKILFQSISVETVTFDVTIENNENDDVSTLTTEEERSSSSVIPLQFKNHAALWTEGQIGDDSFVQSIEHLIKDGIISVSSSYTVSDSEDIITREIPQWTKNNIDWWLQGLISDDVFLQNVEYLIENEIIVVVS